MKIGTVCKKPFEISTPIMISHMSFGALAKEIKIALAKASAMSGTLSASGEGGMLNEERKQADKYIIEFASGRFGVSEKRLALADGIEIKIGQAAKAGMGGHLPAKKVTKEIAKVREIKEGTDAVSPARHLDIKTKQGLKEKVNWLRSINKGPIGIKIASGNIEKDLEFALFAEPDFVTFDGVSGATGSAQKLIKDNVGIPSIAALSRAQNFLEETGQKNKVQLFITGGLRTSADFTKALALGADAVYIATAALMALGCQQYRICETGNCPMAITTQNEFIRKKIDIEKRALGVSNFINTSTKEIEDFCRLMGLNDIKKLSKENLRSMDELTAKTTKTKMFYEK